ncbi:MAG: UDP-3-O-(3-hydroxymyristoyl)glucosamine N-acyltransferase, partial [Muribaculaceae bacterium]|nr:UDP-3-O-(3-hydroxymyristoyl)glucosamine N-acyltransferase [Paludibacteraceae bacterium]MBR4963210.1 UDP-3-O-(3-hydroxymyristoyl)glucosamine N-acyltransferase [Muribaculaceae bacterium]
MEFSVEQIASFLHGEVVGDGSIKVSNLSKIDDGKPGTLSFLANSKYTHHIYETKASAVLVRRDFIPEQEVKTTLIKVDDPYACLALLLNMVDQATRPQKSGIEENVYIADSATLGEDVYVGAFAYIANNASIGSNTKIYPQAYIGDNVKIGTNCIIYPGVKIYHNCVIGNNVIIHAGTVIGSDGFGFAPQNGEYVKIAQIGNVIIEDNVEIGSNTSIDRATMGSTVVKRGAKLDNLIQVAHNVEIGESTVMAAQVGVAGSTKVGKHCMIGGQVGFAGHITIGDNVNIGAQSGIPNNVEAKSNLLGYPAIPIKEFARQVVLVKRLPEINSSIKELQKEIEKLKSQLSEKENN